jgi:hypothetical protein
MRATILVPFDDLGQLQGTLCKAMKVAERLTADLILLRVNCPQSGTSPQLHEEHLYSELKALQSQCTGCPTPVRIEAMGGPVEQAIVRYAAQQNVDLILSSEIGQLLGQKESEGGARGTARADSRWMENSLLALPQV